MIFVQMIDEAGRMWLIPMGRVIGFRTVRDEESRVLYAYAYVDELSIGNGEFRAPIPRMHEANDGDTLALARWINALMTGPRGVNYG